MPGVMFRYNADVFCCGCYYAGRLYVAAIFGSSSDGDQCFAPVM